MFLILSLGITCTITYQNVSAVEIVSDIIEINNNTANGPDLYFDDIFGSSIANIGDLNGDGITDIAVGASGDNGDGSSRGAIHIMFMNSNGTVSDIIEINDTTPNGPDLSNVDTFGSSIANIGDLNNDGITDIAVGASGDNGGGSSRGAIHIMFMNSNGTVSDIIEINDTTPNGPNLADSDYFGLSIANIGDLNGDGITDIAAGIRVDDSGFTRGAIHIMFMNSNGTVSDTIEINSNTTNGPDLSNGDNFGSSIANIGDLNNDGITDIAVGASGDNGGGSNRGAVHIMFMNSDGTISDTIEINGTTPNGPDLSNRDTFGSSIANIGDLNNDGITDIAVGASRDGVTTNNRGDAHILFMNSNGTVSYTIGINDNTANSPVLTDGSRFGISIANIGDLNNDGVTDIAVGARNDSYGALYNLGAIHIMFMDNSALLPPPITNITSNTTTGTLKIGDTITFTLTTNSTDNGATVNGIYNSVPLSWSSIDNGATYTAIYTVSEGETDQTTPLQITNVIVINSIGSPSLPFNGTDVLATIDANSPKFTRAETISTSQIGIILDQNVINNTASPNDFTLGGVDGGSIGSIAYVANNVIGLNIAGTTILDTDSVTLSYNKTSGSFDEASGNSLLNFAENVTNTLDTPPVITLNGDNPQTIELGSGYTELGATTNDGSPVTINSDEFVDEIGTYSIYYDSADTAGINAIQVIRTVNIVDTTPPVITLTGANPQIIKPGDGYIELGATTDDGSEVTINSDEFRDTAGTYSIYYDSADTAGNSAIQVIRTVVVIPSTTSCTPPTSGDWIVTSSCTINSNTTIQGDVIVQNGSLLNIPSGVTLDIDFTSFNLTVQSGSGVLIKSGGTVT